MKKIIAFLAITAILMLLSPNIAAYDDEFNGFDALSPDAKYFAYYQAVNNSHNVVPKPNYTITYDDFLADPYLRLKVDKFSKYIRYDDNHNGFYIPSYVTGDTTANDFIMDKMEEYGLADYNRGGYKGPQHAANSAYKDSYYSGGQKGYNGSVFDFGNGYSCHCYEGYSRDTNAYYVITGNIYFNDTEVNSMLIWYTTSDPNENYPKGFFYLSNADGRYYVNFISDNNILGTIDVTSYVTYVPQGMTNNDITPSYISPIPSVNPFVPEDGDNQEAVNEKLQEQINDTNNWLEKIYSEEVSIHSTLKSFFSPLSGLLGCGRNIESICNAILSKLDNLTVRIKNSDGTDINFGDLELGDINVDFDVVYKVTGITKIESANDLTVNFSSYKSTLENKLGLNNARQTANNFSNALFGTNIFNQNGSVNTSSNPSFTATKPTLYVYYNNVGYDLFANLTFTQENLSAFKDVVSFFLLLGTFLGVFRYIPALVGNITGLEVRHEMIEHAEMQNDYINEWNAYHDTPFSSKSPNPFKGRWI